MDARRESRFEIYVPVKVTSLHRPDQELDCVLLDISATGLKIISPENLQVDEIIALEAEDHLALADVRYSQPRGDKFTVGAERLHLLQKVALPKDQAKIDQIQLLISDYRDRLRTGVVTGRPDVSAAEAALLSQKLLGGEGIAPAGQDAIQDLPEAVQYHNREQLLQAAVSWVAEHWEKVPAGQHEGPKDRIKIIDRLTFHLAERLHADAAPPPAPPAPAALPPEVPVRPARVSRPIESKDKPDIRLSLPATKKPLQWRRPLGVAAAVVMGLGLAALFWSYGTNGAAKHLSSSIASMIPANKPAAPPQATAPGPRHVQIRATEPTWVLATSDGKKLFSKKFVNGESREFDFSDKAVLRIGNARGAEISLDGKLVGPIGGRGQVRTVELSAAGYRLLASR